MNFEPNKSQIIAGREFIETKELADRAEEKLKSRYCAVEAFINTQQFADAREYLRSMPNCASKVLYFRAIIVAEEQYNQLQDLADTKGTTREGEE